MGKWRHPSIRTAKANNKRNSGYGILCLKPNEILKTECGSTRYFKTFSVNKAFVALAMLIRNRKCNDSGVGDSK